MVLAPFDAADINAVAAAADPAQAHLTAAWFGAADPDYSVIGARRDDGSPLLAIPFQTRSMGPFTVNQVAGSYWPFRSFPIAADLRDNELAAFLADPGFARAAGRIWRMGPIYSDDPTASRLIALAPAQGWQVIRKPLAQCYELDLAAIRAAGPWPKGSTARKNRARERKLAGDGAVEYRFFDGTKIDDTLMEAMAAIEAKSWLAQLDGGGDTKFLDPKIREIWSRIARDPGLAPKLFGSLMTAQDKPIAFTFGLEIKDRRYYIANNYDADYAKFGPGKLLLYKDFEQATERNIGTISWGAGDAGYKTDMGAAPGPDIVDLLFVRGRALAALLRPIFLRKA
ncbi:GNAT family N-acetyltransferase [Parasphingopyxis sp. CP4]|uniref:GNAT family N-acetyltransferase n=1 Tax=Parasphingopyxis sp. CP4 TaxID=2724527 RepID=UPI0015A3FF02|nr:GNAT family N-acetyltransferase [Parasphingopyxis sp. CP4]QLC21138.1 GNAT family N-acetyltransferase [Parasphingopyxis sp. CP4]